MFLQALTASLNKTNKMTRKQAKFTFSDQSFESRGLFFVVVLGNKNYGGESWRRLQQDSFNGERRSALTFWNFFRSHFQRFHRNHKSPGVLWSPTLHPFKGLRHRLLCRTSGMDDILKHRKALRRTEVALDPSTDVTDVLNGGLSRTHCYCRSGCFSSEWRT